MTTTESGRVAPEAHTRPIPVLDAYGRLLPSDSSPAAEVRTVTAVSRKDRRRARWRTARAWFIVLLVVAAAAALAVRQIDQRLARRDQVAIQKVALTAEPVDVVTTGAASVVAVLVEPRQKVTSGEAVAKIDVIRPSAGGGEIRVRQTLVAPIDGIVASVPTNVGAAVQPGGVVVRLYDPARLNFHTDLDLETATRLEVGMQGRIDSDVTSPVPVRVVSIEPSLDPGPTGDLTAVIQLAPLDQDQVRNLLPGLIFSGFVDERTAP